MKKFYETPDAYITKFSFAAMMDDEVGGIYTSGDEVGGEGGGWGNGEDD